jgi:hypothetical protein
MSINGINNNPLLNSLGPLVRSNGTQSVPSGNAPARPATERAGIAERAAVTARPTIASQPTTVPAEAPAGTDPALWNVLTTEERAFFSKSAALGPLTYGKIKNATMPTPPAMRGGRLDVRA